MAEASQNEVLKRGQKIFAGLGGSGKSVFNKDWWYGKIMDWSMQNQDFKTQMFRFVDVLPMLDSGAEVSRHLKEYFAENDGKLPSVFNIGLGMGSLAPNLMANTIKKNVTQMAKLFIAGETASEALKKIQKSRKQGMSYTIDILGEACLSEKEAQNYTEQYLTLIDNLCAESKNWKANSNIDEDSMGPIPIVNLSVKLTAIYSQIHPEAFEHSKEELKKRFRPILQKAMENNVFINMDMEKYEIKDLSLAVFRELLLEDEFRSYRHFGVVIQAYLRDAEQDVIDLVEFAKQRNTPFSVRLVKGAYWDYETIGAWQKNWNIPVYSDKIESDANFERCTKVLLENAKWISTAIASHNVRSLAYAMATAESLGLAKNALEFQMLYGMAAPIKTSILSQGYRLREYCPIGDLLPGMSYLVRRLLENTSNQSFLKSKFADDTDENQLLADPNHSLEPTPSTPAFEDSDFINDALQNFSFSQPRQKMTEALNTFREKHLGKTVTSFISGTEVSSTDTIENINPSDESVIGHLACATVENANEAVNRSREAYLTWKKVSAQERSELVSKVADILSRDRFLLMACEVIEAGKTWHEADGDICEAIDFCRYYAKDILRLDKKFRVGSVPGEQSLYEYVPRGVVGVIAPWNFPLAILTGMVAAGVVSGNTVVMKPAEQTPFIADFLMKAFIEAGCPEDVVQLIQGRGEEVGDAIVGHKHTSMVSFTGSREVGEIILQKAAKIQPGQKSIKRCLTELGGKNGIIVDADADLDEAVAGVLYSAFGFQGQKCSACSRAIILESVYDRFLDRLVEGARSIPMGPSENPAHSMGPIVDKEAYERILTTIKKAKQDSEIVLDGAKHRVKHGSQQDPGYFVGPTIFSKVSPQSPLAQEEIFGPVLAVICVKDMDEALNVLNDTPYGLTGGIYSRSPAHIERARTEADVGNFYINRGCTGALVDRHPFGGFKLSGGGSKTGGPDYLTQFMDPRVVSENTLRRGFSPDLVN